MMTRKVPNIEQMSQIECGLCCCLSILHFYKSKETLLDLRRDIEKGRDGYSIGDLKQLLNKRNFDTGSYQVKDVNKISELPLPLIAFWDNQHYVVIYKVKKNKVYIMDPSKGYINYEFKEFSKHFSNIVLLSFPNENYQSLKSQFPSPWIRVFSSFSKVKGRLILTLLFSIISYLIILSVPVMTSKFINSALGNTFSFQTSFLILFSLLCLYLISILARSMGILFSNIFFSRDIESFTFKHLLKLPYSFFELRAKGDILYRISSLSGFRELFTNQVVGGVVDIGTILSVVIYMFLSSKTLSIIALILSLINFLFLFSTRKIMYDTVNRELQEQSLIYSVETEALNTISSIKISGLEDEIYENWSKYLKNVLTKYKKRSIVHILYNSATNVFQLFAPIIILIFGLDNVLNGKILLGEVVAFQTMASILFSSEISIFNAYTQYILAAGYLNRVNDIWLENEENVENGLKKCSLEGRIDIKDLSFSYSKDSAPVIENLNLTIEPGQRIALVGQSGSGKSTLSKILSGLYKIDTGKILFDGVNINQIDKKILSQNLGVVPQDSFLLNRSILDNITLKHEVTSQKIEEVCKAVQIYDEIMAMPMKFNTIISEMGSNISGGQRQRIALARALINNPSIVILDEATSAAKGKLTIIAHVACNNTKDSMELARHAESLGVDAIATIPPIYFRLPEYSVAKYWNDISSAAPNTDYVIYNIPQLAGVALTPSLYTEMLKNPRVIGVKNSSMPVQDIQTFVSLGGEDHIVFNGPDEQFLGGRLMGAKAGIGGTYGAMPELFLKLNQLIADKDLETARELQYAINAIIGKLTATHGNMYGVIKEVLKINEGLNIGSVRSPLTPVTEEDRPVVEAAAALIRETKERFL
ncbi:lantibiotic export protein [Streptococcus pneumoniae]|nr:lantibiotic export protein [Streptococcus pneumoniae]